MTTIEARLSILFQIMNTNTQTSLQKNTLEKTSIRFGNQEKKE